MSPSPTAAIRLPSSLLAHPLPDGLPSGQPASGELVLEAPACLPLPQALERLGVRLAQPALAVINGQAADFKQILEPGDVVRLLPQISGGTR